jgi:hypothetical protein
MIELPRALARQFRAVLRRCLAAQESRGAWPLLLCQAGKEGLTLQARVGEIAVRLRQPGETTADAVVFRATLLAECEGNTPDPVTLENLVFGKGQARWSDGEVARALDFETVTSDSVPPFPALPEQFTDLPDSFLAAFQEASVTAARESARFGIARVQLRGRKGAVVGTDGRQLLVWGGFALPWKEDVLVPRLPIFGFRDTPMPGPVAIGCTEKDVALQVGPWTFALTIDTARRYPQVDRVIPQAIGVATRLRLHPTDAALLQQALPQMPGRETDHAPVTLQLGPEVAVRARADEGPTSELSLTSSTVSGRPVRLCTDRTYLRRAARLGFNELQVIDPTQPLCCREGERLYVWVPLSPEAAIPPEDPTVHVCPSIPEIGAAPSKPPEDQPPEPTDHPKRRRAMPAASTNGHTPHGDDRPEGQSPGSYADLFSEAEALRAALQDALGRTSRLLAALKQQRRKAKAVDAAMTTLRQLQLGR